jgi:hypothetical protein
MPEYYKHDLARWEGEGGSHGELMPPSRGGLPSNVAGTPARSELYCLEGTALQDVIITGRRTAKSGARALAQDTIIQERVCARHTC